MAESVGEGELEFEKCPPEDLLCPVCLSVFTNPTLTSCCGNHFCLGCIERIRNDGKPCPLCQELSYTFMVDKSVARRTRELNIKCPRSIHGCTWVGKLGALETHTSSACNYVEVLCEFGCGTLVPSSQLAYHKANRCPNRPYTCPHCNFQHTFAAITEMHWPMCESYPVECRNGCGIAPVKRRDLPTHIVVCPLEVIPCDFRSVGCDAIVSRNEMQQHLAECVSSHVAMVPNFCRQLEEKNDRAMAQLVQQFEEKLKEKDEQMAKQHREFVFTAQTNERKVKDLQATVQRLTTQVGHMERTIHLRSLPPIQFNMNDFDHYFDTGDQWFSEPFYTHEKGYKMCLSVFAYGIGQARGRYVSIFANLMKGEYDDVLCWPFLGFVDIKVTVDGVVASTYTEMLEFSERSPQKATQRVVYGEVNKFGQGRVRFIPHDHFDHTPDYITLCVNYASSEDY